MCSSHFKHSLPTAPPILKISDGCGFLSLERVSGGDGGDAGKGYGKTTIPEKQYGDYSELICWNWGGKK